jgi:hypothetical protein
VNKFIIASDLVVLGKLSGDNSSLILKYLMKGTQLHREGEL